ASLPAGEVPHARARPPRRRAVRARRENSQPHLGLGAQGARTLRNKRKAIGKAIMSTSSTIPAASPAATPPLAAAPAPATSPAAAAPAFTPYQKVIVAILAFLQFTIVLDFMI